MAVKYYMGKVAYEGCVLGLVEENHPEYSDFFAVVWDEETQTVFKDWYGTTLCASMGWAKVDATPEVIEKANAYMRPIVRECLREKIEARLSAIKAYKTVKVVKGRKVPIGTVAQVKRVVEARYGTCVVIEVNGTDTLISAGNVQVVYEIDEESLDELTEQELRENPWRYYHRLGYA